MVQSANRIEGERVTGVAIVLPPREGFSPGNAGAIALLVRRMAGADDVVLGLAQAAPFAEVRFKAVRPSWFPGNLARRYAGGVARAIGRLGGGLVEVHNRPDVALFLARRFPRIPVVLFLHNDPQGMRGMKTPAERGLALRLLAGVVAVSAHIARRVMEGVANPVREASVLSNCLDLSEVPVGVARRSTILFAGRVVSDKGADSFVDACALALPHLPGWTADIVGADRFGPDSPETPWLAALRPKAVAAGVAMRGYRPHAEVLAAMAAAAIVVVPSRWAEPFGLTALEAMACGAVLVASDRGGLPEVYGDAAVVIDPDDRAGLAGVLVALARDPAWRAELAGKGLAQARRFDVDVARERLAKLRSDVLSAWSNGSGHPI
jgi:glycosyltransferase involved in cell wall biosynthesis